MADVCAEESVPNAEKKEVKEYSAETKKAAEEEKSKDASNEKEVTQEETEEKNEEKGEKEETPAGKSEVKTKISENEVSLFKFFTDARFHKILVRESYLEFCFEARCGGFWILNVFQW